LERIGRLAKARLAKSTLPADRRYKLPRVAFFQPCGPPIFFSTSPAQLSNLKLVTGSSPTAAKDCDVSVIKLLKYGYLAYFSQPKADRPLYKVVRRNRPKSIVEIGVGQGLRTKRLLAQVLEHHPAAEVRYTGIDLFEARSSDHPGMSLKQAHAAFKPFGVKSQFIPGDPFSALARAANGLLQTDLVIISADQDTNSLTRAWMYVPRMLHDQSLVYREEATGDKGETTFRLIERVELEALAKTCQRSQRRAA
jgi:hypothetical protein